MKIVPQFFGGYRIIARGEQTAESDIDILILPDKSQHFSLFTLSGMYVDLKELLNREVDLITEGGLMPFARESAERDKILIYVDIRIPRGSFRNGVEKDYQHA